jgi:hypothetical protein
MIRVLAFLLVVVAICLYLARRWYVDPTFDEPGGGW